MEKFYNPGYSSNPFIQDWIERIRRNDKLEELQRIWRACEQEKNHRDAMLVARLKTEYKNVENITSLCKVTIL